ncbi:PilN domain-containing protein [Neisseria sp. Ec49-e6-T10]|uniref:PilN domain-containing protein n=1 Tax=Neisseria sp. Ec49-e6-T10 TaxID=3140744 RepID=UPI003EBBE517
MILINLLPYREQARQAQEKQFIRMLVISAILGVALSVLIAMGIESQVSGQKSRVTFLKSKVDEAKKEIESVKTLKEERDRLLDRKKKVEELQRERGQVAKMLDDLTELMPDGVYLTSLVGSGNSYVLNGEAVSDNRIAMLMSSLPSTGIFSVPELTGIKKNQNVQGFSLKANLLDVLPEQSEGETE